MCIRDSACTFAGRGRRSPSGERLFPARYAHYVNAVLMTCGMYNGSGDFAVKVGLPAKSGVGGGIMAVLSLIHISFPSKFRQYCKQNPTIIGCILP